MANYKIAIIGLGSIGKRHLLNIHTILTKKQIKYTIDIITTGLSTIDISLKNLINKIYTHNNNIPNDYDIIFVTNPTNLHYDTIKKFAPKSKNMFIEKPVFDNANINITNLQLKKDSIYYVACPLRYLGVIQYVKNNINLSDVYSTRAICSSYLPNWRKNIDYRLTYSADASRGGGVSLDLIHEWDYLIYLFGNPKCILNFQEKISNLHINSDDISIYIAKYTNMLLELHLDYFGRVPIRELHLFSKNDTIIVDIIKSDVKFLKQNKIINFQEDINSYYIKELENFFDIIENKTPNTNDIYNASNTLKIAKGVKNL